MDQAGKRVVVDSVAFGEIFRFPKVLRAITGSMQPPRLVVGLLAALFLIAAGQTWDAWLDGEPMFHPEGLVHGPRPPEAASIQAVLEPIAEESDWTRQERQQNPQGQREIDPDDLRAWLEAEYAEERAALVEQGVDSEEISRRDHEFAERIALIDSVTPRNTFRATVEQVSRSFRKIVGGVLDLSPATTFDGFVDIFARIPAALWSTKPWFVVAYGVLVLLIMAFGGGALCRMTACDFAGRERLRATDGFEFAARHWVKLVLAPLLPLIIAGLLAGVLVVAGFVFFGIPYLDIVGGVLYGVGLFLGFLLAFVLLAYAGAFLMVLPAVSVEACGPADAVQRAFAYLLSRPLHLLGYVAVGLVGLAIGYFVVALVAVATLNLTSATSGVLTTLNPAIAPSGGYEIFDLTPVPGGHQQEWDEGLAATLIRFWEGLVIYLVVAWIVSYLFSASTIIYMLMRKAVDDQDYSEIWRPGLVPGTLAPLPRAPDRPISPASGEDEEGDEGTATSTEDDDES